MPLIRGIRFKEHLLILKVRSDFSIEEFEIPDINGEATRKKLMIGMPKFYLTTLISNALISKAYLKYSKHLKSSSNNL